MGSRRCVCAALAAAASVLALPAVAAPPAVRAPITQAQSGKSFQLARGAAATLRLSSRWLWAEPRLSSRAIALTPVEYFRDPGYREWKVVAHAVGTTIVRSVGRTACTGCGLAVRRFSVTFVVVEP